MVRERIVIVGACRTPVGVAGGGLKNVLARELLHTVFKETIRRTNIDMQTLDGSIAGTCIHSPDELNVSRVSTLLLGLPNEKVLTFVRDGVPLDPAVVEKSLTVNVPGYTVSRNCGSGVQAVISAVQAINSGDGVMFLVGGVESMSHAPFMIMHRDAFSYTPRDVSITDSLLHGLTDPLTHELMGVTADRVAQKYGITREDQDKFAAQSHLKAYKASRSGKFKSQIVPVHTYERNILGSVDEGVVSEDKTMDPGLSVGKLAAITSPKLFFVKGGTVTYGNTCRINDGASSFLVMTLEKARELGLTPEAEIVNYGVAALDPSHMGEGPTCVIPPVLEKVHMNVVDVDIFEINEAFAATTIAVGRSLAIPEEKLNVYGGAIALGHPVGATGAILTTKAINLLKDFGKEYAMVSMCVGNGQGVALLIRKFS
ncbi:MAG: thiolase family protein [bacterium]|nr:thiolase family protein [bacterium]